MPPATLSPLPDMLFTLQAAPEVWYVPGKRFEAHQACVSDRKPASKDTKLAPRLVHAELQRRRLNMNVRGTLLRIRTPLQVVTAHRLTHPEMLPQLFGCTLPSLDSSLLQCPDSQTDN